MGGLVSALDPLLDAVLVDTAALGRGSLLQRLRALQALQPLLQAGASGLPRDPHGNGAELPLPRAQAPQGWQTLASLPTACSQT